MWKTLQKRIAQPHPFQHGNNACFACFAVEIRRVNRQRFRDDTLDPHLRIK